MRCEYCDRKLGGADKYFTLLYEKLIWKFCELACLRSWIIRRWHVKGGNDGKGSQNSD